MESHSGFGSGWIVLQADFETGAMVYLRLRYATLKPTQGLLGVRRRRTQAPTVLLSLQTTTINS